MKPTLPILVAISLAASVNALAQEAVVNPTSAGCLSPASSSTFPEIRQTLDSTEALIRSQVSNCLSLSPADQQALSQLEGALLKGLQELPSQASSSDKQKRLESTLLRESEKLSPAAKEALVAVLAQRKFEQTVQSIRSDEHLQALLKTYRGQLDQALTQEQAQQKANVNRSFSNPIGLNDKKNLALDRFNQAHESAKPLIQYLGTRYIQQGSPEQKALGEELLEGVSQQLKQLHQLKSANIDSEIQSGTKKLRVYQSALVVNLAVGAALTGGALAPAAVLTGAALGGGVTLVTQSGKELAKAAADPDKSPLGCRLAREMAKNGDRAQDEFFKSTLMGAAFGGLGGVASLFPKVATALGTAGMGLGSYSSVMSGIEAYRNGAQAKTILEEAHRLAEAGDEKGSLQKVAQARALMIDAGADGIQGLLSSLQTGQLARSLGKNYSETLSHLLGKKPRSTLEASSPNAPATTLKTQGQELDRSLSSSSVGIPPARVDPNSVHPENMLSLSKTYFDPKGLSSTYRRQRQAAIDAQDSQQLARLAEVRAINIARAHDMKPGHAYRDAIQTDLNKLNSSIEVTQTSIRTKKALNRPFSELEKQELEKETKLIELLKIERESLKQASEAFQSETHYDWRRAYQEDRRNQGLPQNAKQTVLGKDELFESLPSTQTLNSRLSATSPSLSSKELFQYNQLAVKNGDEQALKQGTELLILRLQKEGRDVYDAADMVEGALRNHGRILQGEKAVKLDRERIEILEKMREAIRKIDLQALSQSRASLPESLPTLHEAPAAR